MISAIKLDESGTFRFDNISEGKNLIITGIIKGNSQCYNEIPNIFLRFNDDEERNYRTGDDIYLDSLEIGKCNTRYHKSNFSSFSIKIFLSGNPTVCSSIATFVENENDKSVRFYSGFWYKNEPITSIQIYPDANSFIEESLAILQVI